MRCKKYLEKIFLSCLVSEIQLFVYIFGWISKWPPEVRKGSLVKFFEVSYYQKNFQPPTVHNSEDRGGVKMPYDFLFTFVTFNQQTADLEKKDYSLEWPAYQDERVEGPNISESWTGTKLGPQTCFVNKQLTDISKKFFPPKFIYRFFVRLALMNNLTNFQPNSKVRSWRYWGQRVCSATVLPLLLW